MRRQKMTISIAIVLVLFAAGVFSWRYTREKEPDATDPPIVVRPQEVQEAVSDEQVVIKKDVSLDAPMPPDNKQKSNGIVQNVPFISQAPFGEWDNEVFQDGCEEASMIMAMAWVRGESLTPEGGKRDIESITQFENKTFGAFTADMSPSDTARIMEAYYSYENAEVLQDVSIDDIKKLLDDGALVIAPMNGQMLGNPHFTPPGPLQHMLVIIGYDTKTKEFVTNDPGTKEGRGYRYDEDVLYRALREYPTGNHATITGDRKTVIAVRK